MAPGESRDLVAVSTDGHGTPASPVRSRVVAEKEAAHGISANAQSGLRAFDYGLGRGTGDGRQQPLETTFAGDEFQFPTSFRQDQFIVPLGDAQDSVDRLGPFGGNFLFSDHRAENPSQGVAKVGRARK